MLVARPGKDVRTPDAHNIWTCSLFGVQADHCWCARNESRARMIYKMQSDQIAGHISLLETKTCGKNMLTSNATNILRWHVRNEARIIYTGKGPKSEKNLALGFNTRFLLEDQNEKT